MSNPTITSVQAVDPVLTNMLIGYQQADDRFVASRVFPPVPVDKDSGTYYLITKKYFFLDELEYRAPGTDFARTDYGVSSDTYTTKQWAVDHAIADEIRANSQVPMDLEQVGVRLLAQRSLIRKEVAFSADFMVTGKWANEDANSATDWDDFSAGDPVADILAAGMTISNATGVQPNTMVPGLIVHNALVNHPDILDRLKYVQVVGISAVESALAGVFNMANYWVAKASYSNTNEAASFSATAIIDDDCLLAYVDPGAGIFGATAGKTFAWAPGGGMGSEYSYRDEARHSDVIQHKEQWDQKITATDLGYLFIDIV